MLRLITALFILSVPCFAQAADGAKFRALGFSADARYFAFEQYGIQDGSGFAYADVFVLDITADNWVAGTPVSALLEDETLSVSAVRTKAKQDAEAILRSLAITSDAEYLVANPFSEVLAERSKVTFHDHYNNSMGIFGSTDNQGSWDLRATKVEVPLPAGCEADLGVVGYKLEIKNNKSGAVTLLHVDKAIPKSRFCAVGYDIEAVVQPVGGSTSGQMVAVIGVYRQGFEGADRRFIAVPFKLN